MDNNKLHITRKINGYNLVIYNLTKKIEQQSNNINKDDNKIKSEKKLNNNKKKSLKI